MRVFWHQGPQEDRKSTEETETKQINLRWEFLTPRPTRRQKEHRRDRNKANQLKMRGFLTPRPTRRHTEHRRDRNKANQLKVRVFLTPRPTRRQKEHRRAETKQINLRWDVFLTPRPTRRQKEHRRDRNKAFWDQLKMRVFWHRAHPQEDIQSTEETETKQINLRWEFFDTEAHKKTDRAQKRQKQSKST